MFCTLRIRFITMYKSNRINAIFKACCFPVNIFVGHNRNLIFWWICKKIIIEETNNILVSPYVTAVIMETFSFYVPTIKSDLNVVNWIKFC